MDENDTRHGTPVSGADRASGPIDLSRKCKGGPQEPVLFEALNSQPRPLLNPAERLLSIWSPKSACTVVLVWHLSRMGALKAALDYHRWPHSYRVSVLEQGQTHSAAAKRYIRSDYTVVRFVRDPFKRAVSMYRHALRHDLMPAPGRWPLSVFQKHRIDAGRGCSFHQFLEALSGWAPERLDVHLRPQRHLLEQHVAPDFLINADRGSLTGQINEMERALGLSETDFEVIDWLKQDASRRHAKIDLSQQPEERGAAADRIYTRKSQAGAWPDYNTFRSAHAEDLVRTIFAADIEAYGMLP